MSAFKALIAAPASLGTAANGTQLPSAVTMRARRRIGVSFSVPIAAGALTITTGSQAQRTPALAANAIHRLDVAEPGQAIRAKGETGCPAGTVRIYIFDEWMRARQIASGTVT